VTVRAHDQLAAMAQLQIALNDNVHREWRTQGFPYYRAVWVECAELLDHYGWKWWKHQATDVEQVKLEIVDIWHFGLSELIRAGTVRADHVDEGVVTAFTDRLGTGALLDFRAAVEVLAQKSLSERTFVVEAFVDVMTSLPMTFAELYRTYVGKNVLNHFRQANGYQAGAYVKTWRGREDNEHLFELVRSLDHASATFSADLYRALEVRYVESTRS
jgi:dimeric dUTPase (all-alpha-NTP-PPase superfamily)